MVCMFVRNTFQHDSRVLRQARTLMDQGFAVTVFATANRDVPPGSTVQDEIRVIRVLAPSILSLMFRAVQRAPMRAFRFVLRFFLRLAMLVAPLVPAGIRRRVPPLARRTWPKLFPEPGASYRQAPKPQGIREQTFFGKLIMPVHRFFQTLRFGNVTGRMAAAMRPIAYHCHDLNSVWAGRRATRIWKAPVVYDAHELWPHRNRADASALKRFVVGLGDRYFARRASAVITVSESIAAHMKKKYAVRDVVVVRNTPPLALRTAPPSHAEFSHLLRPRFLYLGGIVANRGLEQLIQALPMTSGGVLLAVGPARAEVQARLEALATSLGVRDRVVFPGKVPEASVVATAAQCDVGVSLIQNYCLSYYYSLPNKLFEYLHAGLPVLVSDFPDMRALVSKYEAGAACDPSDPASIARGMDELARDPAVVARFKENALRAAQDLNWENEQQRLLGLYQRLVPPRLWPQSGSVAARVRHPSTLTTAAT